MFKSISFFNSTIFPASCYQALRVTKRWRSMYEPEYIDYKPELPVYESLLIRMRGYDFVPLESYAKYVHSKCRRLGLSTSCYPVPARTTDVKIFIPGSSTVNKTYHLALYERVVKVDELTSTLAPVLFESLQLNLPSAVQLAIDVTDENEDEFRYVPDLALMEIQAEIAKIEQAKQDRKRK